MKIINTTVQNLRLGPLADQFKVEVYVLPVILFTRGNAVQSNSVFESGNSTVTPAIYRVCTKNNGSGTKEHVHEGS